MQITINQSEIESAITTYINGLFKLNPGTKIQIELKATRGAEGATAIIDIVADAQVGQMAVAAVQEPKKKEVAEAIHDFKATSAKLFTAPVVIEVPAILTVDEAIASLPEVVPEAGIPEVEVPAVPTRTSLFAGLKKPVNA